MNLLEGVSRASLDLCDIWAFNQVSRNAVRHWISPETITDSIYYYGLRTSERVFEKLPLDTGGTPIQHDLITQFGARMQAKGQRVRYLEIGVSVLKCVHTQLHFLEGASVVALDIEEPNPLIEGLWRGKKRLDTWNVASFVSQAGRRTSNYMNYYEGPNSNSLYYVAGDAFDMATYDHLRDVMLPREGPLNLILSDGFHEGEALLAEAEGLISRGLLANTRTDEEENDFTMVWDDCDRDLRRAMMDTVLPRLRSEFAGRSVCVGLVVMPGWIGRNEPHHSTCIFSTLDISGPHLQASRLWEAIYTDVKCD